MNAAAATAVPMLVALVAFGILFLTGVAVHLVTDLRGPAGTGHHCQPGTCGVCDTFGTWSD